MRYLLLPAGILLWACLACVLFTAAVCGVAGKEYPND